MDHIGPPVRAADVEWMKEMDTQWEAWMAQASARALPNDNCAHNRWALSSFHSADTEVCTDDKALAVAQPEYLPPTLLPSTYATKELKTQEAYIAQIEKLLAASGLSSVAEQGSHQGCSAFALRQTNRMLRAKCWHLQKQLQAAHTRCRRSEQINAEWRAHHSALRQREHEQGKLLSAAQEKLQRVDDLSAQVIRLREQLRQRTQELAASMQRCTELEQIVAHLRDTLSQAMRSMHPENAVPPQL
uniref:Uncharacterized protein n=1 Tax=Calcidiscus leptoporus TaxID=127549 RepID=A0A7S0JBX6_9EUKA|mmetsp:Transcript_48623/g.112572  ORF Transcript_48623/g.112572 Transcript_48623/m.112572 type:complete len:245 (+) Transcript_48623:90-824(+)